MTGIPSDFRNYSCYYSICHNNILIMSYNQSCWYGLNGGFSILETYSNYESVLKYKHIYITKYEMTRTRECIPLLLSIINEITECKEVIVQEVKCIKFELMPNYSQSLILLNFIRYLWHSPVLSYSLTFFKKLKETDSKLDPLERLTTAAKNAAKGMGVSKYYPPGHSNLYDESILIIRKTEELKEFNGKEIRNFLTNYVY